MSRYRLLWCALIGLGLAALAVPWASAQVRSQGAIAVRPPAPPPEQPSPPPGDEEPTPPEIPENATPEEIAEFCITKMTEMADRCVERNTNDAALCIELIEGLLADGEVVKARRVARWCIHAINDGTDKCVRGIHHLCRRCSRAIIRAGGDRELVEEVRAACREQIERAVESRRDAVAQIKEALGDEGVEESESPEAVDAEALPG